MTSKPTNPKDSVGIKKGYQSVLPKRPMWEVGLAMLEGALKYGRHNYRVAGVRASTYYDACLRHLDLWWEGQGIDPDSGLPHIIKAMACLMVLRDAEIQGKLTDDRPPKLEDQDWMAEVNKKAAELMELYGHLGKEAFTQRGVDAGEYDDIF